ncbi:ribonuclease H-like domain-containing protein [Tanacetum coccineum]
MVLSLVVSHKWPIHQLDVKNAFLNGDLSETVYMYQPPGFVNARFPNHVCRLQRSLYGLKQAPPFSPTLLQYIIDSLHNEFDMTDLGTLNYFLGISADRNSTSLFLSQRKYAPQLLERAHIVHCNPSRIPTDTESKLGLKCVRVQDPTLYRSLAGGLQYLTFTCPDLSYAVQQLYASATTSLVGYTDADWVGYPSTRRSTSGYYVFLGNNLLSWSAKRQHTISRSSAEAEYRSVANVVAKTAWLRNLLRKLHSPLLTATLVYCDNVSAVYISVNPVQHQRTKHIEIDIHFVRDMVTAGQVRVLHVPSRFQYADIFTKGLPSALFEEFRSSLSGSRSLAVLRDMQMESSETRKYPSLIQTYFDIHTVDGVFLQEEMLRLRDLGANTLMDVPYTEDQIMAMVRKGKQRGTIPVLVGFWRDRAGTSSLSTSLNARTLTPMSMSGGSGSGGGGDDEPGADEDAGGDEDVDGDEES